MLRATHRVRDEDRVADAAAAARLAEAAARAETLVGRGADVALEGALIHEALHIQLEQAAAGLRGVVGEPAVMRAAVTPGMKYVCQLTCLQVVGSTVGAGSFDHTSIRDNAATVPKGCDVRLASRWVIRQQVRSSQEPKPPP